MKLIKLANKFEIKYAQRFQVAEYDMGTAERPNMVNIIKNIKILIRAMNQAMFQNTTAQDLQNIVQQLNQAGITLNL